MSGSRELRAVRRLYDFKVPARSLALCDASFLPRRPSFVRGSAARGNCELKINSVDVVGKSFDRVRGGAPSNFVESGAMDFIPDWR